MSKKTTHKKIKFFFVFFFLFIIFCSVFLFKNFIKQKSEETPETFSQTPTRQFPWEGDGITAGWINNHTKDFTVVSRNNYWLMKTFDYSWQEIKGSEIWANIPKIENQFPWEGDGITAGWINEEKNEFTVISKDKYWVLDLLTYNWKGAGRLENQAIWQKAPKINGKSPWEGPDITIGGVAKEGISAGWIYKNVLTVINKDKFWNLDLSSLEWSSYGLLANRPNDDVWKKAPKIENQFPWDGDGITAGWINEERNEFTVISKDKYWVLDLLTYTWKGAGRLENQAEWQRVNPEPSWQNLQAVLDYWSDETYKVYKNTNFDNLINTIQGINGANTNIARALAGQVIMHLYYYQKDGKNEDLEKAKNYINLIVDKYENWGKIWGSSVTMNQLGFSVWWLWEELEPETRADFFGILSQEADFLTWILEEIQNNPYGTTLPDQAPLAHPEWWPASIPGSELKPNRKNIDFITTEDYLYDTRAEENSWNAQFLATAYNMFPNHPNAERWNQAAKCFAFHTFSRGETACGITSRTISDDFTLGNHNLSPNPLYTIAGINQLQQGQFSYILTGRAVPTEFTHNIEESTNSEIWKKNIKKCMDDHFRITPECHAGADWGDKDMQSAIITLSYWNKVNNDYQAKDLLEKMLAYFYFTSKRRLRFPQVNPVPEINIASHEQSSPFLHWWFNLERHPQVSAKFLISTYQASHHNNSESLVEKIFPKNLGVKFCEEIVPKKKLWSGELDWSCDSQVRKEENYSLKLTSEQFSDAELYSPLIMVKPNKTYKISYWVKTSSLQPSDAQVYGRIITAQYNVQSKESDDVYQNRIDSGFGLGDNVEGVTDWQKKSYLLETTPETKYIRLRAPMGLAGKAKGTVWFDKIKIEEIKKGGDIREPDKEEPEAKPEEPNWSLLRFFRKLE